MTGSRDEPRGDGARPRPRGPRAGGVAVWTERWLPRLLLAPSVAASLVFVYGFILVTGWLSLTDSRLLPVYRITGFDRYRELFANDQWWISAANLARFGIPFMATCVVLGLVLAILLDQRIRAEGVLRAVYVYPLALSLIVTGAVWQWILNPGLGIERLLHDWGWQSASFDWLVDPQRAIYCVVVAAVWQSAGFVAALFLAGLRGIDNEIIRAAQVDGAKLPTIYWRVVLPGLRPVLFSVLLILCHIAIKTFDLVVAMTAGGPGTASWLPSLYMYTFSFERSQLGVGAASAMMMLAAVVAVVVPLMYLGARRTRHGD